MDWRLRFITRTMKFALSLICTFVSRKRERKDQKRFPIATVLQSADSNIKNSFTSLAIQ